MTVVVDATGTKLITTVAGASVNYTGITVGSGNNRALVVTVACGAAVTAPNAHWDTAGANQAMTLISAVETQTNVTTFMFGLRNPVAGLKTLNVAWTTSAVSNIEAISFTGAETTSDAKAFINANFAKNAATVASIAIGLVSPADSIGVASYATSATFSSITQTNIFTDTTNTGCEGGASRANGAGASILFTGADTGTTGNKVMVGFVVAPPSPVLHESWQSPFLLAKKGLAIALMASGLFSAPFVPPTATPLPAAGTVFDSDIIFPYKLIYQAKTDPLVFTVATPTGWNDPLEQPVRNWRRSPIYTAPFSAFVPLAKEDIPVQEWTVLWQDPVRAKPGLGVQHQPSSTFLPLVPTAAVLTDWPDFARRAPQPLDVQSIPWDSLQIAATTTPTGWNDPLEVPVRNWQRSPIYTAPFLALGVPPAQVWFPPNVTPDVVPTRAKPPVNFIPWTFLEPAPQVFFPYDRWPDTAPAAKRVAQNPDWSYGTFVTPTATPTYTQWTQWPDFAPRARPAVSAPFSAFLPLVPSAAGADDWPDFARRAPRPLDVQLLPWNSLQITATVPTMAWVRWPDFAPRARPATDAPSLAFVPLVPTATVIADWPDFARRKQPPLDTQLFSWSPTQFAVVVPTMAWTNWPDFAPKAKPLVDIRPWTFVPTPKQVFFPYAPWDDFTRRARPSTDPQSFAFLALTPSATVIGDWPDFAQRKPQLPDTQPQPYFLAPQAAQYQTVVYDWPDFAQRKPQLPDTNPLIWSNFTPAAATFFLVPDRWPDSAARKKPVADFIPWTFIPTPRQVFFPYGPWDDFARKKPQPLDTQPLAWNSLQIAASAPTMAWVRWPDFAPKAKPLVDIRPWTFITTPQQVFFPYGPWDDFARRRRPLNYDPLAFLQTVRTPWVTMTTWPDFAPIRGKIGLHSAEQQFTARFPGTLFGATVTVTMSAFEVNTDGAAAAILVVQSQPAVDAAVAIKEIGILGGSVTP